MEELNKDLSGLDLAQLVFGNNPVEQLAFGGEFEDQINAVAFVECILETENVGMRNTHEYTNLLLQTIDPALLLSGLRVGRGATLLKLLDGIASAGTLFCAQVNCSEVTLAQLALNRILLTEAIGIADARISKDKTGNIKDGELVTIVEITSFVAADDCIVHVGSVTRQVFDNGDLVTVFVLAEQETVAVADSGCLDDAVCSKST